MGFLLLWLPKCSHITAKTVPITLTTYTVARQGKSDIWVIASAILRMTSSQACSDEEMGNSTHSNALASRHCEGSVVSMSRFACVRLDRLRSRLLRWTHSRVAGLLPVPLIGSRSTCEIERGRSPLLPASWKSSRGCAAACPKRETSVAPFMGGRFEDDGKDPDCDCRGRKLRQLAGSGVRVLPREVSRRRHRVDALGDRRLPAP